MNTSQRSRKSRKASNNARSWKLKNREKIPEYNLGFLAKDQIIKLRTLPRRTISGCFKEMCF